MPDTANRIVGSSPRVRGTLDTALIGTLTIRFIPASAGNACSSSRSCRATPVHPRECGERGVWRTAHRLGCGSSPRVRGTLFGKNCKIGKCRFIPASAGNANRTQRRAGMRPVHPRECGERAAIGRPPDCVFGSSPRVRGTRNRHGAQIRCSTVHPRECGERTRCIRAAITAPGSSPRVRGTLRRDVAPDFDCRFIPASAGNAHPSQAASAPETVHPRECGERRCTTTRSTRPRGSSPRVRGTLVWQHLDYLNCRFIPASAGNASGLFDL